MSRTSGAGKSNGTLGKSKGTSGKVTKPARRTRGWALLCCALLSLAACARAQRAETPAQRAETPRATARVALRAARLLDVRSGQLMTDAVILVEDGKINTLGQRLAIPPQTKVLDLGDVTLLPGLIDAHTHITYHFDERGRFNGRGDPTPDITLKYALENARRTVEAGVTTIRNLGDYTLVDFRLRDLAARGEIVSPDIIASGAPLTHSEMRETDDAATRLARIRQFVRERASEGAGVVKIFEGVDRRGRPLFSSEEIRAAVEEAARLGGLRVAVHAHEAEAVRAAVEGGCASIEHGTYLDDASISLMVKHRTTLVPTLYLPTHYLENMPHFEFGANVWEFFERMRSHNLDNLRRARQAGVQVVAGSDAVAGLHGRNARELNRLVKAGMTPHEALRAATLDAARLLGIEAQTGELRAGLRADIIAVAGDPSRDIARIEQVMFVMKSGRIIRDRLTKSEKGKTEKGKTE